MSKKLRADLILLTMTAFWGISFPLMRNVLVHVPALAYLSMRFILAAIIVSLIFVKKHRNISKREVGGGAVIGILLVAGMAFQVFGLYSTTASNSAFITSMNVAFVPLVLSLFFKQKTPRLTIIGIIIATAGLFLISGMVEFRLNPGDFLTLLCAIAFAFQIVFISKFSIRSDTVGLSIVQLWTAAALTTFIWLVFDRSRIVFNAEVIIVLAVTAVFGTAIAFTAQILVQKDTNPSHAALIFTMEPMFALVFTMLIPDSTGNFERLTLMTAIGCLLILSGTIVSEFKTIFFRNRKRAEGSSGDKADSRVQ